MPITIYGTDWCADTRRTRAFLAGQGVRPNFIDIEARPELAEHLIVDSQPLSIPVVVLTDGVRLDEPSNDQLAAALAAAGESTAAPAPVRHRTKLNQSLHRFEQYRNDDLVASAEFVDRDGGIVIVSLDHYGDRSTASGDENIERLTAGLVEIVNRSGRSLDIDIGGTPPDQPATEAPIAPAEAPAPTPAAVAALINEAAVVETDPPDTEAIDAAPPRNIERRDEPTCHLTQRFTKLWSQGADPKAAIQFAANQGIGRLTVIKALHDLWEMPLTPEAMALAFDDPASDQLSAMFHVLGWIIEQNLTSTLSELQAFDDATGVSVKTQALSLAERPRDTIALVDRMGPGLHLRTIDEQQARTLVSQTIREADGLVRIQDQSTLRLSFGWMFLYQSVEYLETGEYATMISGNAPLLVDRFTGALWVTGTESRPDAYAENYVATGNPLTAPR